MRSTAGASQRDVAAFTFTAAPHSYAARTGRPANVGVIGVALFRERRPEPVPMTAPLAESRQRDEAAASLDSATLAAPVAGMANAEAQRAPKLGTGHGARIHSVVEHTDFDRRSKRPDEVIRIRYDSHENLVALGVIRPQPFPDSPLVRYVPDPN